jgi:hypothetical protein
MLADVRPTEAWTTLSMLAAFVVLAVVIGVAAFFVIRRR